MEGQIWAISRHMDGQETSDSDPHQGKLQNYLAFCTHPDVRGFRVISAYIHENRFKSHVWKIIHVLRDCWSRFPRLVRTLQQTSNQNTRYSSRTQNHFYINCRPLRGANLLWASSIQNNFAVPSLASTHTCILKIGTNTMGQNHGPR